MRRIYGLDLNGWHDIAVHDVRPDDGEADEIATGDSRGVFIIDGGVGGLVVDAPGTSSANEPARFIGGPQAALSVIGRGPGWGPIGATDRRAAVRTILTDLTTPGLAPAVFQRRAAQLQSVAEALTAQAHEIVVTVPDLPGFDDDAQERLLSALKRRRVQVRLLWRPVALVLAALEHGRLKGVQPNQSVAIIHHTEAGFDVQRLVLRALPNHPGLLAPQRGGPGWQIAGPDIGLSRWEAAADEAVRRANRSVEFHRHDASRLPYHLLIDDDPPHGVEIVRSSNSTWSALAIPSRADIALPSARLTLDGLEADHVLVSTVLAAPFRDQIAAAVAAHLRRPVDVMASTDAATGALVAGRRIERGIPHYLDTLEQVSLIVLLDGDVVLRDLVPADAVVAANREYVSAPITELAWPAGARQMDFYLKKGGTFRRWHTTDTPAPSEPKGVEVQLRQMPAQGRAQVSITSRDWSELQRRPIRLDWSTLELEPRTFDEIAAALKPRPTVPDRVTGFTHIDRWRGTGRIPPFEPLIVKLAADPVLRAADLLKELGRVLPVEAKDPSTASSRFMRASVVDYDGHPPGGVSDAALSALDRMLDRIAEEVRSRLSRRIPFADNDLVRAATWAFGRCPEPLQDELLFAAAASLDGRAHPLLAPRASDRVIIHGIGRTFTKAERIARAIDLFVAHQGRPNVTAALAALLTRPKATPQVLDDARTRRVALMAIATLEELKRELNFRLGLKYALQMVGGVLRTRELRPNALVVASSPEAAKLLAVLTRIEELMGKRQSSIKQYVEKHTIVHSLLAMLEGNGGDAGLLVSLENLSDETE